MTLRLLMIAAVLFGFSAPAFAQDAAAAEAPTPLFDTSYTPSPSVTARIQRKFLEDLRWSAGVAARDALDEAFAERAPADIWLDLVASDGLEANNVTDALASYWVLNWITANAAYSVEVDHEPIRRQLASAFANDQGFRSFGDQQRQELAESYVLNFLLEHAALNSAIERQDFKVLGQLSAASVARFRQTMDVDLLAVQPGPNGFEPRQADAR